MMTPNEINQAIAKHLGWREGSCGWWCRPDCTDSLGVPNFYEDLNAINKAVRTLKHDQTRDYVQSLVEILDRDHSTGELTLTDVCDEVDITYHCCAATAAQRAEAFLKTVGKWKE